MSRLFCRASLAILLLSAIAFFSQQTYAQSSSPTITDIGGYSDGIGVANGRWTGQPSVAPPTASNVYLKYLAIGTYALPGQTNPYYWIIKGNDFGTAPGSVNFTVVP